MKTPAHWRRAGAVLSLSLAAVLVGYEVAAAPVTPIDLRAERQNFRQVQLPPKAGVLKNYKGLHAAAARGDVAAIRRLASAGAKIEARDGHGRTPLMVAGYQRQHAAAKALIEAGARIDALDNDRYDLLTIASVLNDLDMVNLAIAAGANTRLITSPYAGTALIAAAHLGHVEVVRALIAGKAPLDHVNNLGWTALIEAVVLGDGGPRHVAIVRDLIKAGAAIDLADRNGQTPLALARRAGYTKIAEIIRKAGGRL
ncbi:MAG: ankyrin repeat domain-containing protein [Alphaproteobacteria bacterium]